MDLDLIEDTLKTKASEKRKKGEIINSVIGEIQNDFIRFDEKGGRKYNPNKTLCALLRLNLHGAIQGKIPVPFHQILYFQHLHPSIINSNKLLMSSSLIPYLLPFKIASSSSASSSFFCSSIRSNGLAAAT